MGAPLREQADLLPESLVVREARLSDKLYTLVPIRS